ncbi:MAG: hypothetical protein DRJ47_07600 [Thermoprotei archaeon]|nr:MAG: hypothetical protein DRJ47_07600 [Thermoprotei archaeon]
MVHCFNNNGSCNLLSCHPQEEEKEACHNRIP